MQNLQTASGNGQQSANCIRRRVSGWRDGVLAVLAALSDRPEAARTDQDLLGKVQAMPCKPNSEENETPYPSNADRQKSEVCPDAAKARLDVAGTLFRYLLQDICDTSSEHDPMEQPTYEDNTGAQEIEIAPSGCNVVAADLRTYHLTACTLATNAHIKMFAFRWPRSKATKDKAV